MSSAPMVMPASGPAPSRSRDARLARRELEFIAKLFQPPARDATPEDRQRWEDSPVSDLIYPNDHPCAGLPRDSVSPQQLIDAAVGEPGGPSLIPSLPEIDRSQCHVQGNWPFFPLNQCARGLNREDPESVASFMACLDALPQDPSAYPASIWLPCPADHPLATTMREFFGDLIAEHVNDLFARGPCPAN